ncbi:hypothetical protein HWV62_7616 [Athelia sp. TMB]|nr:hypothetical protein HWV62_7616 [Athelia sp. TMB]
MSKTSEDGQEAGLLRITEIIQWPEVSTRAGSSKTLLSFQRGYLPLFRVRQGDFEFHRVLT